jgi:hypothetical protein
MAGARCQFVLTTNKRCPDERVSSGTGLFCEAHESLVERRAKAPPNRWKDRDQLGSTVVGAAAGIAAIIDLIIKVNGGMLALRREERPQHGPEPSNWEGPGFGFRLVEPFQELVNLAEYIEFWPWPGSATGTSDDIEWVRQKLADWFDRQSNDDKARISEALVSGAL